jgi:hypothetical protein
MGAQMKKLDGRARPSAVERSELLDELSSRDVQQRRRAGDRYGESVP